MITILFLAPNASDTSRIDSPGEFQSIHDAIDERFKLIPKFGIQPDELQDVVRSNKPHIIHFSGHARMGKLLLSNNIGHSLPVSPKALSELFRILKHERIYVHCVVLNACYSETLATELLNYVHYVVAVPEEIGDKPAIKFSSAFYRSLASKENFSEVQSLDFSTAVDYGCNAIDLHGLDDHSKPRLLPKPAYVSTPPMPPVPSASQPLHFDWITIPSGPFLMGSQKSVSDNSAKTEIMWRADELPQHSVDLGAFRISKYPVTVEQFSTFVKAENYRTLAEREGYASVWTITGERKIYGAYWRRPSGFWSNVWFKKHHPVTCVSWRDAIAFCKWANVRLPTEAEWEKASRGIDGFLYPWGSARPNSRRCNFRDTEDESVGDTTKVGSYGKGISPFSVHDMAGNVIEWTQTLYKPYPYSESIDVKNLDAHGERVLRGGSFNDTFDNIRCARRLKDLPTFRSNYVGFRVVHLSDL